MTTPVNHPNPLISLLPLILILILIAIVVNILAKEKGKNVALWTILACIPIINLISIIYIVGTSNKRLEDKLDKVIEVLNRSD
jgi:hypothetical protein